MGQFEGALCDGGGRGFALARDRDGWESEFDAVLVERLLDHRVGLAPDDELLARQGHHLHPDLHREIAEVLHALHLQRLEDQRRKFFVLLQIEPDLPAKVVIDERSGVIVIGRDVRVSTVAVAQGNLTVTIAETPQVSQPAPFSRGRTTVVPRTKVGVTEDGKKLAVVNEGVSLQQLVDGLNALGIGPLDMIAILQAMKANGAIQADIEVM